MKLHLAEWAPVPGYPGYAVSDTGLVYSFPKRKKIRGGAMQPLPGREMKTAAGSHGYPSVRLGRGAHNHKLVHRLVARAFIGECPEGYVVDHINGERTDNRLTNLRYLPRAENDAQRWNR